LAQGQGDQTSGRERSGELESRVSLSTLKNGRWLGEGRGIQIEGQTEKKTHDGKINDHRILGLSCTGKHRRINGKMFGGSEWLLCRLRK